MIIQNLRPERLFLGWYGKFGKYIGPSPATLTIDDSYSQNSYLRQMIDNADLAVTSFAANNLDFVAQDELTAVIGDSPRCGQVALPLAAQAFWVPISPVFTTLNYAVTGSILNSTDPAPFNRGFMVDDRQLNQFHVTLEEETETANYVFQWIAKAF